jgi:LPS-assembly lipoprotein
MSGTSGRRTWLLAAAASAVLAGCGYELRKAPTYAFKSLVLTGNSAFITYLRRNIRAAGTVTVLTMEQKDQADAILDILGERRESVVVSTNAAGEVREMQLRLIVRFQLRTPGGKELLGPTEIQQQRDITYSETAALAKEGESELLFRDMQNDIAQQTMRRLAAVKSL